MLMNILIWEVTLMVTSSIIKLTTSYQQLFFERLKIVSKILGFSVYLNKSDSSLK